MPEEAEARPLTVDELLPFCSPLTREGLSAAVANMRAAYAEQRVAELEAQLAKPQHNGRTTVKAK